MPKGTTASEPTHNATTHCNNSMQQDSATTASEPRHTADPLHATAHPRQDSPDLPEPVLSVASKPVPSVARSLQWLGPLLEKEAIDIYVYVCIYVHMTLFKKGETRRFFAGLFCRREPTFAGLFCQSDMILFM